MMKKKKRILNASGKVRMNRVDGDLSLSRAFGDFYYKNNQTKPKDEQKVISVPEFRVLETTDVGHFIFLACDGVYDVMSNQEIVNFICTQLAAQKRTRSDVEVDVAAILSNLLDHCLEKKSQDNMTALMIRLCDGAAALKSGFHKIHEFIPGPYFPDGSETFKTTYEQYAKVHGNLTLQQCLDYLEKHKINNKT